MAPAAPSSSPKPFSPNSALDLPSKLKWYYARLFPIDTFTRFLSHQIPQHLSNREISFTLSGDIYLRFKSFPSSQDLLSALKRLNPIKIDIGAIYNFPPVDKSHVHTPLTPLQKELVFDIDMTDYEPVMANLSGGSPVQVTDRNWEYMAVAVKVLDQALKQDFGFKHVLWVYSGRRGIHCWVCDQRARKLTNEQRSALADYLHLRFEGAENAGRTQFQVTNPLHPTLARAKQTVCEPSFNQFVLEKQGILDDHQRIADFVNAIPGVQKAGAFHTIMERVGSSTGVAAWNRIQKEVQRLSRTEYSLRSSLDYVMFKNTYPRLDVNVSREIGHLLKAPFSVHPKTGRVCVPFRASEVDAFVPGEKAPELGKLLAEMTQMDGGAMKGVGEASDRLREAVEIFEQFVRGVEDEGRKELRKNKLEQMDRKGVMELMRD